jgi:hypothetical protein
MKFVSHNVYIFRSNFVKMNILAFLVIIKPYLICIVLEGIYSLKMIC